MGKVILVIESESACGLNLGEEVTMHLKGQVLISSVKRDTLKEIDDLMLELDLSHTQLEKVVDLAMAYLSLNK